MAKDLACAKAVEYLESNMKGLAHADVGKTTDVNYISLVFDQFQKLNKPSPTVKANVIHAHGCMLHECIVTLCDGTVHEASFTF